MKTRAAPALVACVVAVVALGASAALPRPALAITLFAKDDSYSVVHDQSLSVIAPGVLANDVGILGSPTAVRDSQPANGTLTLRANGSFTYVPNPGYVGADSFRYHVHDVLLLLATDSAPATVTITVKNAAPVAKDDAYAAQTGVRLSVPAPGVLSNDSDPDGDSLTATKVTDSGSGSVNFAPNGSFTFTSGGSFTGPRTFTYRVSDGIASSTVATVTINVTGPAPTPTPAPTPVPTPAPTPVPTPTPTLPPATLPPATLPPATLPPVPTLPPLPTLPLTPTLPPTPTILPTLPPTPIGSIGPLPSTTPIASGTPTTTAQGSTGPAPASSGGPRGPAGGGTIGAGPSNPPGGPGGGPGRPVGFTVGRAGFGTIDGLGNVGVVGLGGLVIWAVPALVLSVPGLLLLLAVLAQTAGGLLWLPVARRWLGGFGLRRRRTAEPPAA